MLHLTFKTITYGCTSLSSALRFLKTYVIVKHRQNYICRNKNILTKSKIIFAEILNFLRSQTFFTISKDMWEVRGRRYTIMLRPPDPEALKNHLWDIQTANAFYPSVTFLFMQFWKCYIFIFSIQISYIFFIRPVCWYLVHRQTRACLFNANFSACKLIIH